MMNRFIQKEVDLICLKPLSRIQSTAKSAEIQVCTQTSAGYNRCVQGDRSSSSRIKTNIDTTLHTNATGDDDDDDLVGFN